MFDQGNVPWYSASTPILVGAEAELLSWRSDYRDNHHEQPPGGRRSHMLESTPRAPARIDTLLHSGFHL